MIVGAQERMDSLRAVALKVVLHHYLRRKYEQDAVTFISALRCGGAADFSIAARIYAHASSTHCPLTTNWWLSFLS
jgi:hypothetical protein